LKIVVALEVLLPTTLYLAVVVALSRLYTDGEITALESSGIGPWHRVKSVLLLALLLAMVVTGLSLFARPWASRQIYSLEAHARDEFDFAKVEENRFYELGENLVFLTQKLSHQDNRADHVFVWKITPEGREVTFASEVYQIEDPEQGSKTLVFVNGHHYILKDETGSDRMGTFQGSSLPLKTERDIPVQYRRKAAATATLATSADPEDFAEYQWRLSTGLSTVLLALLALPLSRVAPRRGKYGKVLTAIIVFFIYYNLSLVAKTWVEKQLIAPFPGIWWPHLGLAGLLLFLLPRKRRRKPSAGPSSDRSTAS
ncbi:MAG: LPS export ABC transporter permease LptF, partial [Desulfuromonadaceae bacterium]